MSISEPFIRRPIGTSLLMLGVLVFGIGAYGLLPVAPLPNVDFPTITVTASYPGASPQTMASAIATPLEQQFTQIPALDQMTSLSGIGTTTITLQFDLSRNIDGAAVDVVTAINAATGLLPKDLPSPPTYRKVNPADFPIMIYAVHSDAVPDYRLDDYANTVLGERLSTVPGVGQVSIFGQKLYAARVQVNPTALAAHGIGLEDVRNALVNATVNEPKGSIEGAEQITALETNDQLFDAKAYGNIIVAYRNGAPVRIKDVGEALNSVQNARLGAWFDNKAAEGVAIQKAPGANTVALVDTIKALMPKLEASIPPSVHVDLMLDRTLVTRAAVRDVQLTMLLTITLVVIVIFLFLRTLWATVIPSLAVPLSLLATFAVMYVAGFSLDNISLMALTISVGFIVDDAIVMIENIVRYIEQGDRPFEAALKGAGQIGFTIISITFSLIAVFIPLFAMGGVIGRLFREFAITVSVAVGASAIVSLTLTPVMCSLFLKEQGLHPSGRFNRGAERAFKWMIGTYDRGLNFVFRHQFSVLVSTLLLMVATGYLYVQIPKGFFPQQDTGTVFGEIDTRQDASFLKTVKMAHEIVDIIRNDPSVGGVFMLAGAYAYNPTENAARVFFALKPFEERSDTANQVVQRLRRKVAAVEGAVFFMQVPQNITVGGRLSRTQYQYTLTDTDDAELDHWAPILEGEMRKLPELQDVASDQQNAAPTMTIDVNRDAAYRLGLSASLIDQTLYDAFGQRQVATIYTATNQYKVVLEVQPQFAERYDDRAVEALCFRTERGAGAAFRLRPYGLEGGAVVGQPSRRVSGGNLVVQPRPRRGTRAGGREDSGGRRPVARAGDVERIVSGHRAGIPGLAVLDAAARRRGNPRRLHRARRALRKLHPPDHHPLGLALGRRRCPARVDASALRFERHRNRRRDPVDRHRQEKRDHDDRLRAAGRAAGREEPARGDSPGLPLALPPDHDDDVRGTLRRDADRLRPGCRL